MSTDEILAERGKRYGEFEDHARITQRIKDVIYSEMCGRQVKRPVMFDDDMIESLEMIAHKIGRIINGDPNYEDSWRDIAGYAQLVADRLKGKSQ